MDYYKTSYQNPESEIVMELSKRVLTGEVFVYPTDTVYGIGSILKDSSLDRIRRIKGRADNKPFSIAVSNKQQIRHYADVLDLDEVNAGPYTFICKKTENTSELVSAGLSTVGVRLFTEGLLHELIESVGEAVATTSANISGNPSPKKPSEIDEALLEQVDFFIDTGKCTYGKPSKIIDLTTNRILRE